MDKFRTESDSLGEKEVPCDAYYGIHPLRSVENFRISGIMMYDEMIKSII